ncbi:MAG: hypothetical protein QG568_310 [Patescibacteria group bacterium]|nr:hypothetical protein [Patescibacteria group bacterium]
MKKYSNLKSESIKLRKQGLSYLEITKQLGISKSCVRNWTKTVRHTKNQQDKLKVGNIIIASKRLKEIQKDRAKNTREIRDALEKRGAEDIKNMKDPLFFLGLGLYWGEGYKNKTQEIGIVNTDPRILKISMLWFEKYYGISKSEYQIRLSINAEYRDSENSIIDFWIKKLAISRSQFTQTSFVKAKHKRQYIDTTYNGTLRIKIPRPLRIHHRILSSINNIPFYTK